MPKRKNDELNDEKTIKKVCKTDNEEAQKIFVETLSAWLLPPLINVILEYVPRDKCSYCSDAQNCDVSQVVFGCEEVACVCHSGSRLSHNACRCCVLDNCRFCDKEVCKTCSTSCSKCSQVQCNREITECFFLCSNSACDHPLTCRHCFNGTICKVCGLAICADCSLKCDMCNFVVCRDDCFATCVVCGTKACYNEEEDCSCLVQISVYNIQRKYCKNCREHCDDCGYVWPKSSSGKNGESCGNCGKQLCESCVKRCIICYERYCDDCCRRKCDHCKISSCCIICIRYCILCENRFCADCCHKCAECIEDMCLECVEQTCLICTQKMCSQCLETHSNYCDKENNTKNVLRS